MGENDTTEAGALELRRLLSSAVKQSGEGIAVADLEGNILFANDAFTGMHGYSSEEVIGKHLSVFHAPEQMPAVEAANRQIREAGGFIGEIWHTHRDGTAFPTSMHNSLLRDGSGKPAAMVGILRDITRAKRAEEALRENEEKYRHLVTNLRQHFLYVHDTDGVFTYVSPSISDILGYPQEEFLTHFGKVTTDNPINEAARKHTELSIQGIPQPPYEVEVRHKNGSIHLLEVVETPVFDGSGDVIAVEGIAQDVTERKRTEEELARHRDHLEDLVEERTRELETSRAQLRHSERLASIGTFAAGIAHEVNNPVGGILLAAENARELIGQADSTELMDICLADIAGNAKRCREIIQRVLKFAGHERSDRPLSNLNAVVQRAVSLTSKYVQENGGSARIDCDTDLPEVPVKPLEIEQALVNVIRNAAESGGTGTSILIRTDRASKAVRVVIQDNGRGIPAGQIEHLFDPFFTTRREQGGTGLGLSIAHGIMTEHGGMIEIQSQPGSGTTVTLSLPTPAASATGVSHGQNADR